MVALVVAACLFWAFGGSTELTSEVRAGRSVAQRALDVSTASLALAGVLGLLTLVSHRPRAIRAWCPLVAAGLGTGAMCCLGGYQLTLLIAPSTPFDTTGDRWFGLIISAQVVAGLLGAIVLYGVRVSPPDGPAPQAWSGSEVLLEVGKGRGSEGNSQEQTGSNTAGGPTRSCLRFSSFPRGAPVEIQAYPHHDHHRLRAIEELPTDGNPHGSTNADASYSSWLSSSGSRPPGEVQLRVEGIDTW